jgi:hypothetical protein
MVNLSSSAICGREEGKPCLSCSEHPKTAIILHASTEKLDQGLIQRVKSASSSTMVEYLAGYFFLAAGTLALMSLKK